MGTGLAVHEHFGELILHLLSGARPGRHAILFIMITIFLDTLGFGIIIPVLPGLITELTGESVVEAAGYGGLLAFSYALMMFLFAPIIGNLSDHFGRRPVLLLSMATLVINYLMMGFAVSIAWLFVGRILSGIGGATYTTANAYIADIAAEDERAARFGMVGAAWGLGFIFGPAIGGLLGDYHARLPFYAAAGLAALNLLYGLLVLPETLAVDRRRPFHFWRSSPFGVFVTLRRDRMVAILSVALIFFYLAHDALPSVWTYYVLHKFSWTEGQTGLALMVVGLCSALVSGFLVGPLVKHLGEARTAYLGCTLAAASFFGYAFAASGWMMFPCIVIGGFMGLVMPTIRGIMSRGVPMNEQGNLQGAISSLFGLTAIFAPLIMTQTFRFFSIGDASLYFPGAAFLLAGCLVLLATLAVILGMRRAVAI